MYKNIILYYNIIYASLGELEILRACGQWQGEIDNDNKYTLFVFFYILK